MAPYGCGACQAALPCVLCDSRCHRPATHADDRQRRTLTASIPISSTCSTRTTSTSGATAQDEPTRNWSAATLFQGRARQIAGAAGPARAGRPRSSSALGRRVPREEFSCWAAAAIPDRLPDGRLSSCRTACRPAWRHSSRSAGPTANIKFERYRRANPQRAVHLRLPAQARCRRSRATESGDDLGARSDQHARQRPVARSVGAGGGRSRPPYGARHRVVIGDDLLKERLSAIHAVGRAASVAPRLVDVDGAMPSHPKVTLVGKGVCFDSGGLDIKPGASMLLMKKDMGGAAVALAPGADSSWMPKLPGPFATAVCRRSRTPIAANAYRPGDVLGNAQGLDRRDRQHRCRGTSRHPLRRARARRRRVIRTC